MADPVGFSPAGPAGAMGSFDPSFGTAPPGSETGGSPNPSKGIWARLSQYLGDLNPEDLEKELKYVQQIIGGFNKVNSAVGQSQVAQQMMNEHKIMTQTPDSQGNKRPFAPIQGTPTVTPQMAASMLQTMGLK